MWGYIDILSIFYSNICKTYMNNVNIVTKSDGSLILVVKVYYDILKCKKVFKF